MIHAIVAVGRSIKNVIMMLITILRLLRIFRLLKNTFLTCRLSNHDFKHKGTFSHTYKVFFKVNELEQLVQDCSTLFQ